jgi:hypothetical protein
VAHHLSKKKLKQLLQLKKNRFLQEMFNLMRIRRQEDDRVKKQEETREKQKKKARELEKDEEDDIQDKMAVIRNRLNDRKRTSRERWNRFAGTESGGGRGL